MLVTHYHGDQWFSTFLFPCSDSWDVVHAAGFTISVTHYPALIDSCLLFLFSCSILSFLDAWCGTAGGSWLLSSVFWNVCVLCWCLFIFEYSLFGHLFRSRSQFLPYLRVGGGLFSRQLVLASTFVCKVLPPKKLKIIESDLFSLSNSLCRNACVLLRFYLCPWLLLVVISFGCDCGFDLLKGWRCRQVMV